MRKKKISQEEKEKFRQEQIAEWLQLPKDILLGASIITPMGKQELRVENYKSILDYREDYILLQAKKYRIQIKGRKLQIAYYTKDEMKICGYITEVSYQ